MCNFIIIKIVGVNYKTPPSTHRPPKLRPFAFPFHSLLSLTSSAFVFLTSLLSVSTQEKVLGGVSVGEPLDSLLWRSGGDDEDEEIGEAGGGAVARPETDTPGPLRRCSSLCRLRLRIRAPIPFPLAPLGLLLVLRQRREPPTTPRRRGSSRASPPFPAAPPPLRLGQWPRRPPPPLRPPATAGRRGT